MQAFSLLDVTRHAAVVTVTLARPEIHNAFNPAMIAELSACFEALAVDPEVRVVVLTGAGRSFCAGADLQWMRESLGWSYEKNEADAEQLSSMYETINSLPKPLIGRINGAALGGGAGLVACCDVAIAAEEATFGFTEVRVGLVPAVISRFVVPKIGASHARALFVSGARVDARRALAAGLIHDVAPRTELDAAVERAAREMIDGGPEAQARVKVLLDTLPALLPNEQRAFTVAAIAAARTGAEGQAGLTAFLEKRRPPWGDG